jgi:hypothetical protein
MPTSGPQHPKLLSHLLPCTPHVDHSKFCHGKAVNIWYYKCMSVALFVQHATHKHHIILSYVSCLALPYFSTLLHNRYDFRKNVTEHKLCVLIFCTTSVWKISHSRNNSVRYVINVHRSSCKVLLCLSDLNETWTFTTKKKKILKYQISWKSIQWKLRCSMQMDTQAWQSQKSLLAISWTRLKLGSNRSIKLYLIQINQPTRCNRFTSLLLDVYVWLSMFWASPRPSSGAYNCTWSLWFYRWREVAGAFLVVVCQNTTKNAPTATLQR